MPERSCIGCGRKAPKGELRRIVLVEGQGVVDASQRLPGRGAYLCGVGCLKAALKRKSFQRAFRQRLRELDQEILSAGLGRLESTGNRE